MQKHSLARFVTVAGLAMAALLAVAASPARSVGLPSAAPHADWTVGTPGAGPGATFN